MPLAALLLAASAATPAPSAALPNLGEIALDAGAVVAWPFELQPVEVGLLSMGTLATVAMFRADTHVYRVVQQMRFTIRRRSIFQYALLAGDGLVDLTVVGAFALAGRRGIGTAMAGANALASVAVTSLLMKAIFRVPRPQTDTYRKHYFQNLHSDAFPSGHTMSAFATAAVISNTYPGAAPWAYAAASVVGLSVIKRGWHWPSDVLIGATLGILIGRVSNRLRDLRFPITVGPSTAGIEVKF